MKTILICDDDLDIVNSLKIYLKMEDFNVITAFNGHQAVEAVKANHDIQIIVMDIMMPMMDGIEAMTKIRKISNVPIILLTAKSEDIDKISGLNDGADDYMTKPFNPIELIARVKSQMRRYTQLGTAVSSPSTIKVGGIELDDISKKITIDGKEVKFTPTEYDILKLFMSNIGKVFSPDEIYECIWDGAPVGAQNVMAVHIRHLREKIEINPSEPMYIKVVWGHGYKMEEL